MAAAVGVSYYPQCKRCSRTYWMGLKYKSFHGPVMTDPIQLLYIQSCSWMPLLYSFFAFFLYRSCIWASCIGKKKQSCKHENKWQMMVKTQMRLGSLRSLLRVRTQLVHLSEKQFNVIYCLVWIAQTAAAHNVIKSLFHCHCKIWIASRPNWEFAWLDQTIEHVHLQWYLNLYTPPYWSAARLRSSQMEKIK